MIVTSPTVTEAIPKHGVELTVEAGTIPRWPLTGRFSGEQRSKKFSHL